MKNQTIPVLEKNQAHALVERLPPDATWEDLMYEIYVHESVEKGLVNSHLNQGAHVKEVRKKYGLTN